MAIEKLHCLRCGHWWFPTSEAKPKVCPKCKSYKWDETKDEKPNPGSDEAIKMGCKCPVLDNVRGQGIGDGLFWINQKCPIHGSEK